MAAGGAILSFAVGSSRALRGVGCCTITGRVRAFSFGHDSRYGVTSNELLFNDSRNVQDFVASEVRRRSTPFPLIFASFGIRGRSLEDVSPSRELHFSSGSIGCTSRVALARQSGGFAIRFSLLGCIGPRRGVCACYLRNCSSGRVMMSTRHRFTACGGLPSNDCLFRLGKAGRSKM